MYKVITLKCVQLVSSDLSGMPSDAMALRHLDDVAPDLLEHEVEDEARAGEEHPAVEVRPVRVHEAIQGVAPSEAIV